MMTTPDSEGFPKEMVAGVALLLADGGDTEATMAAVAAFTGVSVAALTAAWDVISDSRGSLFAPRERFGVSVTVRYELRGQNGGPLSPVAITEHANAMYRAAFFLNSARRIRIARESGGDAREQAQVSQERVYWDMHKAAALKRKQSANNVMSQYRVHGKLLGWLAIDDVRTSPDCRAASGRNFYIDKPPVIGWPGAAHPRCRCMPVAPFPGGKMVNDSVTVKRARRGFEPDSAF